MNHAPVVEQAQAAVVSAHDPAAMCTHPDGGCVGSGLDPASAAALNKLLAAEARANMLVLAPATALWRARAASAKRNGTAARSQLRAAASFVRQAATALRKVQPLRDAAARALEAGKVAEV